MPDKNNSNTPNTSGGIPTGEELDKRIIKYTMAGLIANHWEGGNGWNNFCKSSAGDYPSIGVLGWEGLGGNGDAVLNAVGLGQYAGQSYSALEPHKEEIQAVLDSPAGHQGQLQLLSEMEVSYLGILRDSGWNSSDPKATTFVMCWMGAGPYCCGPYASKQPTANLDQIYQHFLSGWANAAGVSSVEGYNNRTESTYAYCQTLDFTKDADLDVIIDMAAAAANNKSGLKKGACATDRGFKVRGTLVEKVPDKTFCEPVYPDYITVSDTMPAWALTMQQDLEAAAGKDPTGEIIKDGDAPEKAPNGMHYSEEDIKTRMEANNETREQAIEALAKEPKYNTPVADNGDGTFTVTSKPGSGNADDGKKDDNGNSANGSADANQPGTYQGKTLQQWTEEKQQHDAKAEEYLAVANKAYATMESAYIAATGITMEVAMQKGMLKKSKLEYVNIVEDWAKTNCSDAYEQEKAYNKKADDEHHAAMSCEIAIGYAKS